jgi:peptide/nickel transport system ATP-binding protein
MAMVLISHDLGAVSAVCDRAAVMYAGRVVEMNKTAALFSSPRHPYTRGLFDAIPQIDGDRRRLNPIQGTVPDPRALPRGCAFAPRCGSASARCATRAPQLATTGANGLLACFHPVVRAVSPVVTKELVLA